MNAQLKANLEKVVNEWMNENCENENWPDTYIGKDTDRLMAAAAACVFDAVIEIQEFTIAQGFLKEV